MVYFVYFINCSSRGSSHSTGSSQVINITNQSEINIKIGEQKILYIDKQGYWESQNPDIATVDFNGVVTGISPGTAFIWFHISGQGMKLFKVNVLE